MSPERRREIRKVLDDNNIVVSAMLPAPGGGPGFNVASLEERRAAIEQYKKSPSSAPISAATPCSMSPAG